MDMNWQVVPFAVVCRRASSAAFSPRNSSASLLTSVARGATASVTVFLTVSASAPSVEAIAKRADCTAPCAESLLSGSRSSRPQRSNVPIPILSGRPSKELSSLSQWTEHCHLLADGLRARGISPLVLEGSLGKRARAAIVKQIETSPPDEPLVIVATGQYLGEGFDAPQLDTLFLAFPVSFKGRLVQYTGRLMRAEEGKTTVRVYDYADTRVPVLRAMHTRRLATYKSLGFTREPASDVTSSLQLAVPMLES